MARLYHNHSPTPLGRELRSVLRKRLTAKGLFSLRASADLLFSVVAFVEHDVILLYYLIDRNYLQSKRCVKEGRCVDNQRYNEPQRCAMTIILDNYTLPKTGHVELNLSFDIVISAEDAQKKVRWWLRDHLGMLLDADTPTLAIGEKTLWRVPINDLDLNRPSPRAEKLMKHDPTAQPAAERERAQ
jgi:hypothetical protein